MIRRISKIRTIRQLRRTTELEESKGLEGAVECMQALGRRCIAIARASVIAACTHIGSGGSPMHRNCACDLHRAHMASAESPMHRNCACDRHRNMRAQCKRRVTDAAEVRVRPSSQHAVTVIATCAHLAIAGPPTHCKLRRRRHRNLGALCNRRITVTQ